MPEKCMFLGKGYAGNKAMIIQQLLIMDISFQEELFLSQNFFIGILIFV